ELEGEGAPDGGRTGAPFLAGLVLGALLGAGAALLLAPARGEVTRRKLGRRLRHLREEAGERVEHMRDAAERELRRQRRRLRRHLPD
ncbi:MAG TPA: YtxH domain-containing protein, partial [Anaeromyxobacteraceae bacterium]|nr:YtxH domain-containing protein [Anaeromyxobacteraceae bacterium]